MQFTIDRSNLDAVASALPRKASGTIPPLVRVDASGAEVTITASSDFSGDAYRFKRVCVVAKSGACVVDSSLFVEAVRSAGDTLNIARVGTKLVLTWGKSRHTIPVIEDLFPREPSGDVPGFSLPAQALASALSRTLGYVEATRASALAGIGLTPDPDNGTRGVFAATDRARLSVAIVQANDEVDADPRTLIPADVAQSIVRMIGKRNDVATFSVHHGAVRLAIGDDVATWPGLDGEFPDWRTIVPPLKHTPALIHVDDSAPLSSALRRHVSVAAGAAHGTLLVRDGDAVRIGTARDDVSILDSVDVESDHDGAWERGFRAQFVADAIDTVGGGAVTIRSASSGMAPHVVTGADDGADGYVLVMPMRVDQIRRGDL